MHSVKNPTENDTGAGFPDGVVFTDFESAQEAMLIEKATPAKLQEAKLQFNNGSEEPFGNSSRSITSLHAPRNLQIAVELDDTNMVSPFANHQEQLVTVAPEFSLPTAVAASNAEFRTLDLPENEPQGLSANGLSIQIGETASYKLEETKTIRAGRSGKNYRQKSCSSSFSATEENSLTAKQEGITIDGRLENSHQLRERKKSKYLSYPYIDPSGNSTDEPNAERSETQEASNLECQSEGSKNARKGSRKSGIGLNTLDKARMIKLSSAEMLSELRQAAENGSYGVGIRYSGPVDKFFSSFRRFVFLNFEDSSQVLFESEPQRKSVPEDGKGHRSTSDKTKKRRRITDKTPSLLKNGCIDSGASESPGLVSGTSKSKTIKQKQMRKTLADTAEAKTISQMLDLGANTTTSSVEASQLTGCTTASGSLEEESRKMGNPCTNSHPGLSVLNVSRVKFVQLLNDVEAGVPDFFRSVIQDKRVGTESNSTSDFMSKQSEAKFIQVQSALFGTSSVETHIASTSLVPECQKSGQKVKEEAQETLNNDIVGLKSDLNGNLAETSSTRDAVSGMDSNMKPMKRKRRRKNSLDAVSYDKVHDSKLQSEVPKSAAILLSFTSGFTLPSIESIFETFSRYGMLNRSETRFVSNSSAQVVFVRVENAKEAFQNLQRNNPFGPVLGSYRLQPLSAPATHNDLRTPHAVWPMNGLNQLPAPPGLNLQNGESSNLMFIKQNLERMTSMLEKEGNNLSAEMRAKLENQIKGFTDKVNSMVGSLTSVSR